MTKAQTLARLELWGGPECTVNRVSDQFFDQTVRTGHEWRISDLDRFAELGVTSLRYPVLWERTAPEGVPDWSWPDERLARLRELGIKPIVGLVHHGSGPSDTNLLDPAFPTRLAHYARSVAERYPWVTAFTPVNEPLTTARFSGLYGHWYPHKRDDLSFLRALLIECRAVALSMQAIREVTPKAQLVQTDDLGKTYSTPRLAYQAEFENERRWLTFDLLCGRVNPDHPLWGYLLSAGISEGELEWFLEHPCPPDIIGINYYLSSERFLDERLDRYPPHTHGGNWREAYADVEAARVRDDEPVGPRTRLLEAWERYGLPIAITEAHNGCTREEQLRWLVDVWEGTKAARNDGVDVRAVTVWSLLGCYDWNTLVTRCDNCYEPGVFDIRGPEPRPTALVGVIKALAADQKPQHPTIDGPGWWHRSMRFTYGDAKPHVQPMRRSLSGRGASGSTSLRPLLINGATGTLGRAFARLCELRGLPYYLVTRHDMDIAVPRSVSTMLDQTQPWAVINTAGYVRVDDAERERNQCYRENTYGPAILAGACAVREIPLVTFSSDLVFDGAQSDPYLESSSTAPLNVYGHSKVEAEQHVLTSLPQALVVRTSAFFGPWDAYNFVTIVRQRLASGLPVVADEESTISPTYVPDLVHGCLDLLIDGERGIWHLANKGAITWADLARCVAQADGYDPYAIEGRPADQMGYTAARPRYTVLGSDHGMMLPSLDDALARYLRECAVELAVG